MNEEFLQYIWANSLFRDGDLATTRGERLRVLRAGEQNRDAGPDFWDARIEMGGVVLAGTVEVHLAGSDWFRHGHHEDRAYDNVILSVVGVDDVGAVTSQGRRVDTMVLRYDERCLEEYVYTRGAPVVPRCHRRLREVDAGRLGMLMTGYAVERLERKCEEVRSLLERERGDWEATLLGMVTRFWSGNVNEEAFSMLAGVVPFSRLARRRDDVFGAEALLLGCAGLLETGAEDEYVTALRGEYAFLAGKWGVREMPATCWRFARVRPTAFPTVRLALLAGLLGRSAFLFSSLVEAATAAEAMGVFDVTASSYWDTRYRLGVPAGKLVKRVGRMIKEVLVVNALVPFLFVYGEERGEDQYREKALRWLEELPPEDNRVVREWQRWGVSPGSALQTQAILQVHHGYCLAHRCLQCKVGHEVFKVRRDEGES
ncbi:MAG: DUF2851 family protein [Odoribacteraceae bacterium]|nr:DUF2851 family protein [Odoribacteraceae bacterium]